MYSPKVTCIFSDAALENIKEHSNWRSEAVWQLFKKNIYASASGLGSFGSIFTAI